VWTQHATITVSTCLNACLIDVMQSVSYVRKYALSKITVTMCTHYIPISLVNSGPQT